MPHVQFELMILAGAVLLGVIQLFAAAASARTQQNLAWAAGARDEPMPPLTGVPGRLDRAFRNFMETFPFFAALVLVTYLGGRLGTLTHWGGVLYLGARAVYLPLYALGIPGIRTLVWFVSIVGLGMTGAAIFV